MAIDRIKLRRLREQADLSQQALAERAGVSQQLVAALEVGRTSNSRHVFKIAEALGVGAHELDGSIPSEPRRLPGSNHGALDHQLAPTGLPSASSSSVPVFGVRPALSSADFDGFISSSAVEHVSWADGGRRFALYAPDETLSPRIEMGDILVLQHGKPVRRGDCAAFFDCSFPDLDRPDFSARVTVGIVSAWDDNEWRVEKLNPKGEVRLQRTMWPSVLAVAAIIIK